MLLPYLPVHPKDTENPPAQALSRVAAVLSSHQVLPNLRHRRRGAHTAEYAATANIGAPEQPGNHRPEAPCLLMRVLAELNAPTQTC